MALNFATQWLTHFFRADMCTPPPAAGRVEDAAFAEEGQAGPVGPPAAGGDRGAC